MRQRRSPVSRQRRSPPRQDPRLRRSPYFDATASLAGAAAASLATAAGPDPQLRSSPYESVDLWQADLSQRFCPALESRRISVEPASCVERFGNRFVWSALHQTAEQLEPLRSMGDAKVDALLPAIAPRPGDDFLAALHRAAAASPQSDAALFLKEVSTVPDWVDWDRINEGQTVFCRFLPIAGVVLFNMSLVGGFSAPKITKVLEQSGCTQALAL